MIPRAILIVCGLFVSLPALAETDVAAKVVPVEGKSFAARLEGITADGIFAFQTDKGQESLKAANLVRYGELSDFARGVQILLVDGSLLVADESLQSIEIQGEELVADFLPLDVMKIPLEAIAGVIRQPPASRHQRDILADRIARAKGTADRLLLDNGDELQGTILAWSDDSVRLKSENGQTDVAVRSIDAVVFDPSLTAKVKPGDRQTLVGLKNGTRLVATKLAAEGDGVVLQTASGTKAGFPVSEIVFLQPLGAGADYLSDLKAAGYRHLPFLSLKWPYHNDRNVSGSQLRCGGRLYAKGIGMHSASRLTFNLEKPYRRLDAELGIDDHAGGRGSVVYRVYVDDESGKRTKKFESKVIRGGDPPLPISVDLSGTKRISLIVDFSERGDELDHANWLDARLIP